MKRFLAASSEVERVVPNALFDSRPHSNSAKIQGGLGTSRSTLALFALLLTGCAVGPNYQQPKTETPAAFAEPGPWKAAAPKDTLPKGAWWSIFHDPALDTLEQQATAASPTLQAAVARRDQAYAVAGVSRADYFPLLSIDPSGSRTRYSGNRQVPPGASNAAYTVNSYTLPLDLGYELDLWGRVRRANESARALADASDATYHSILLGVQADVAQNYFVLRALSTEHALVVRSIKTRQDALDLVNTRFKGGASGRLDVLRAETELATAQNDALVLDQRRTALQHLLAVLCGQLPGSFKLPDSPVAATGAGSETPDINLPALPVGLPSELLERRPDVAAAERTLSAFNAQIGVAKAAFFPQIHLIGSAGYNSNDLDTLLDSGSHAWSFGPSITLPVFQGGRNTANYERAKAAYAEANANYRQRVLVAFQDVEDGLSALRFLDGEAEAIGRAVTSAREAADLSTVRYKAGLVSYLEVVDAERTALQNERTASQLNGQRFSAIVLLVKALGGGW
jgi:multidrug efflux system outer membrane protein